METPKQEVARLTKLIKHHNKRYYLRNDPEISDGEYDQLYHRLVALEKEYPELLKKNSPTQTVGSDLHPKGVKIKHKYPMLSIANAFTEDELAAFVKTRLPVYVDVKYDGMSLSLHYLNGRLAKAISRGDGEQGEDLTRQARLVPGIKEVIETDEPSLVVRGEILISKEEFAKINEANKLIGERIYSNERNAAAGLFRSHHAHQGVELMFQAYNATGHASASHSETMKMLGELGFDSYPGEVADTFKQCVAIYKQYLRKRKELPFEVDGVVYKANATTGGVKVDPDVHPSSSKYAADMIAYKFPALEVTTVLKDIVWQVGKFGTLTPVGILEPVDIAGVTVSNVTLHNLSEIHNKDVRLGDTIVIKRSGDVIPFLVKVVKSKRTDQVEIEGVKACPCCGSAVVRDVTTKKVKGKQKETVILKCVDHLKCPSQIIGRINSFVSRDALDVEGVSIELITKLYAAGYVTRPSDLYKLTPKQLDGIEKMGDKSQLNFFDAIKDSLNTTLNKFIYGLCIPDTGRTMSKLLANTYGDLDRLMKASKEELEAIPTIGPVKAHSIHTFFQDERNREEIQHLLDAGFTWDRPIQVSEGGLTGDTYVLTGSFSRPRPEIKKEIESKGGKVTSGVSSKTTAVIAGDKPGQSKLTKATAANVKVLTEGNIDAILDKLIKQGIKLW